MKKLTTDEFILKAIDMHEDKYNYSKSIYTTAKAKLTIICPTHGEFQQTAYVHTLGCGCKKCAFEEQGKRQSIPSRGNSIGDMRPDLVVFLKNKEDSYSYAYQSNKRIELVCPDCKLERDMPVCDLSNQGFSCVLCSDGISVPEKFMGEILIHLGINFEKQKKFDWVENKRYDFYLPDYNIIIEIHGGQHYVWQGRGRSLEQEQENDRFKYNVAIQNGVNKYIIIDARYSNLEYLRESYIKSISPYYDLSRINWCEAWSDSQGSTMKKLWKMWDNRDENESIKDIARKLGISRDSVLIYLKKGHDAGMCSYTTKIGHKQASVKRGLDKRKPVYQYDKKMKLINKYSSITEAEAETGFRKIGAKCRGVRKSLKDNCIWSFDPNLTQEGEVKI